METWVKLPNFNYLLREVWCKPAEWMFQVIGAGPGSHEIQDYYEVWINSSEYKATNEELDAMERKFIKKPETILKKP